MTLSEFKQRLAETETIRFIMPEGQLIPLHFHITEAGLLTRNFIDCGKTVHTETNAVFQVWTAADFNHRLTPQTLIGIIEKSDSIFGDDDPEVLVEVQLETIGTFGIDFKNGDFHLVPLKTDCRAKTACMIEAVQEPAMNCAPGSGCC